MPLTITLDQIEGPSSFLGIRLKGKLDSSTAAELSTELSRCLGPDVRTVIFELEGLEFLSSAGIQVFVGVKRTMRDRGGVVLMVQMQPQISKVFEIVKSIMGGFLVFASVEELDAYLETVQADYRRK